MFGSVNFLRGFPRQPFSIRISAVLAPKIPGLEKYGVPNPRATMPTSPGNFHGLAQLQLSRLTAPVEERKKCAAITLLSGIDFGFSWLGIGCQMSESRHAAWTRGR